MPTIAMTREIGSRGQEVALGLAAALGIRLVRHAAVEHEVADRLQLSERAVHRYLEGGSTPLERWRLDKKGVDHCTAAQMLALAAEGNVLLREWGAIPLLRPVSHVVSVRVCAPLELRINTLMARQGRPDPASALKEITVNDAAHQRICRRLSRVRRVDRPLYDLVLNTERVSIDECVELVQRLARKGSFQETPESRATLAALTRTASMLLTAPLGPRAEHAALLCCHMRAQRPRCSSYEPPVTREDRDLVF